MRGFLQNLSTNLGVVAELLGYLWRRKLWWMIPMMIVLMLFGLLLVAGSASGVGPFIYTLF